MWRNVLRIIESKDAREQAAMAASQRLQDLATLLPRYELNMGVIVTFDTGCNITGENVNAAWRVFFLTAKKLGRREITASPAWPEDDDSPWRARGRNPIYFIELTSCH